MATSGSTNFTLNRNEMINSAFRLIGVGIRGETLTAEEIANGSEALNLMLKAWEARGLPMWRRDALSVTLVASQAAYTIGPSGADVTAARPLRILEANYKDTNNETASINVVSLEEWSGLPDRSTAKNSPPTSLYFDPTITSSTVNIWPMPDATAAAEWTLELWVHSPIEDMDGSTDDFDCPPEWLEAIKYNLALRLADEYGIPDQMYYRIRSMARDGLAFAENWDVEDVSITFEPNGDF